MFNLKFNPFERQAVHDFEDFQSQPLIDSIDLLKQLKNKIIWNFTSPNRFLIKIIAFKGYGKSTTSYFLQEIINQQNNHKLLSLCINKLNTNVEEFFKLCLQEFNVRKSVNDTYHSAIKNFLLDKKLYLFIDFQDVASLEDFKTISKTLEVISTISKNICIILTMNKSHSIKMDNISYVLGKYTLFEMQPFSLENTKNLLQKRLELARENPYSKNPLYPFTDRIIEIIYRNSGGIPRNILSACDLILSSSEDEEIEEEEVSLLLKNEFSKKVIYDMTEDEKERELLIKIYEVIKTDFNGEIMAEKELHEKLSEKLGILSVATCRKKIRQLNKFGLINITKGENSWNNTIKII